MTTVNIIKFENDDIATSRASGSISTLTFDLDFTLEQNNSQNPLAPTHRVLARSPSGKAIEVGGVWKKQNQVTKEDYFTLNIREYGFNANLGTAAGQDDESVQAVIAWGPRSNYAA
jgi:uncharacterized protein (DUF736 family)